MITFESQVIKLEDGKSDYKLGTQLKRFTDWLKQMKRVNPNPTELRNDAKGEQDVQNIAEHSNEPEEIITENNGRSFNKTRQAAAGNRNL